MQLSIVIPCYNKEAEIQRTLMSVIFQLNQNCELIIIDDASTDGSVLQIRKTIQEYQSTLNIRLIQSAKNRGVSKIRNLGMRLSKGSYITFLDGDDCIVDGFLNQLCELFREMRPHLISVQGQWRNSGKVRPTKNCFQGLLVETARNQVYEVRNPIKMMERYIALGGSQVTFQKRVCGRKKFKDGQNMFEDFGFYFSWIQPDSKWIYVEKVCVLYEDKPSFSLSRRKMGTNRVELPTAISIAPSRIIKRHLRGVWFFNSVSRYALSSIYTMVRRYPLDVLDALWTKFGIVGIFVLIKRMIIGSR